MPRKLLIVLQVLLAVASVAAIAVVLSVGDHTITLLTPGVGLRATAKHWYTLWGHEVDPASRLGRLLRLRVGVMYLCCLAWGVVGYTAARARHRALRRARGRDVCPNCSYDLTGNVSGICPECGAAVPYSVLRIGRG